MTDKKSTTEIKRLPKGQRTHIRRLKQAARKEVGTNNPQPSLPLPMRVHKKSNPE